MRRTLAFAKRNVLEMLRDPVLYIFCIAFPVLMTLLFQLINYFIEQEQAIFQMTSLVPGMCMFSCTFVMLVCGMLVSKDRASAFLIRLYTSPMRTAEYVAGYALPCLAVGVLQQFICIFFGWLMTLIFGGVYFSFGAALLLVLGMLPILIFFIFLGILFGSLLNDKAAPGICSAFICAAGVLGGAWMPLDTMGGLETFCRFLPFYPSVYIGRIITGAAHTLPDAATGETVLYAFDGVAKLGLVAIFIYLALSVVLSLLAFRKNMTSDKR